MQRIIRSKNKEIKQSELADYSKEAQSLMKARFFILSGK